MESSTDLEDVGELFKVAVVLRGASSLLGGSCNCTPLTGSFGVSLLLWMSPEDCAEILGEATVSVSSSKPLSQLEDFEISLS